IIDIVNTYAGIGLTAGLTGLALFVSVFLCAAAGVWRRMRSLADRQSDAYDAGRGLLAVLACVLVTIATVSSVTVIPVIYWLMAGLAVGYARSGARTERAAPRIVAGAAGVTR